MTIEPFVEKYLQALRALHALSALDQDDPELHVRLVAFYCARTSLPTPSDLYALELMPDITVTRMESLDPTVRDAAKEGLARLGFSEPDLEKLNTEYLQKHPDSGASILACARSVYELRGETARSEVEAACFQLEKKELSVDISVRATGQCFEQR